MYSKEEMDAMVNVFNERNKDKLEPIREKAECEASQKPSIVGIIRNICEDTGYPAISISLKGYVSRQELRSLVRAGVLNECSVYIKEHGDTMYKGYYPIGEPPKKLKELMESQLEAKEKEKA